MRYSNVLDTYRWLEVEMTLSLIVNVTKGIVNVISQLLLLAPFGWQWQP